VLLIAFQIFHQRHCIRVRELDSIDIPTPLLPDPCANRASPHRSHVHELMGDVVVPVRFRHALRIAFNVSGPKVLTRRTPPVSALA